MSAEIITPLLSALGGAAVTLGMVGLLRNVITSHISENHQQENRELLQEINNIHQISIESLKQEYQKELEVYKTGLLNIARYSEYQFKLYNELWSSLYTLRNRAEDLWQHASTRNLAGFAKQLKETKQNIEKNILLINDDHLKSLFGIIQAFERYQIGKVSLINYRNNRRDREEDNEYYFLNELELFINNNEQLKNEYISLIEVLAIEFKNHLREPMN